MSLENLIAERLNTLHPTQLTIQNDSEKHIGHKGAENGAGHYTIEITSSQFDHISPITRHRIVYRLLADLIPHKIHALCIKAQGVNQQE